MYAGGGHKKISVRLRSSRYMDSSILHAFYIGEDHSYFRIIAKTQDIFHLQSFQGMFLLITLSGVRDNIVKLHLKQDYNMICAENEVV
jgi:hypothetical protein